MLNMSWFFTIACSIVFVTDKWVSTPTPTPKIVPARVHRDERPGCWDSTSACPTSHYNPSGRIHVAVALTLSDTLTHNLKADHLQNHNDSLNTLFFNDCYSLNTLTFLIIVTAWILYFFHRTYSLNTLIFYYSLTFSIIAFLSMSETSLKFYPWLSTYL